MRASPLASSNPTRHIRRLQQRRCSKCNQSLFRCDTFLTLLFLPFVVYPLFFLHIPVVVVILRSALSLFLLLLLTSAFYSPSPRVHRNRYSILIFQIYLVRDEFEKLLVLYMRKTIATTRERFNFIDCNIFLRIPVRRILTRLT